jgi:cellulose synthase/poly-beta-1,6-N-acetylglucosamine synthase-like glycosyltransferase
MPKVSIVVPNYNHARFLRRRVESVLRQTFHDFELILLDDCWTDDSPILSKYADDPRVKVDESLCLYGDWKSRAAMALTGKVAYLAEPLNFCRFHVARVRSRSKQIGMDLAESFPVRCWLLDQATRPESVLESCDPQADFWVPAVMSTGVSLSTKLAMLRHAWEADPHPIRNAVRPLLRTLAEVSALRLELNAIRNGGGSPLNSTVQWVFA